jgi:hypothetical protein
MIGHDDKAAAPAVVLGKLYRRDLHKFVPHARMVQPPPAPETGEGDELGMTLASKIRRVTMRTEWAMGEGMARACCAICLLRLRRTDMRPW